MGVNFSLESYLWFFGVSALEDLCGGSVFEVGVATSFFLGIIDFVSFLVLIEEESLTGTFDCERVLTTTF